MDVVDLRNFYAQRLGTVARRFIGRGIRARWPDTRLQRVVGIGYATPYLGLFREEAERCLALMPAPQGVVRWPSSKPALAALVEEDDLPLTDAAVDRVLLVHALENSTDPGGLLREVWRVLAGGGRLLAVVPNRRGLWARMDTTPFGHGRPYSRSQITHLLRETWFTPTGWGEALYVPPVSRGWFLRSAVAWERAGATISAPFAGVHIVEATKQVYRAIPARRERRRLMPGCNRCSRHRRVPLRSRRSTANSCSVFDRHCGQGSAVTAAASMPIRSARPASRSRSSAVSSALLISPTRPRPRNTSAE